MLSRPNSLVGEQEGRILTEKNFHSRRHGFPNIKTSRLEKKRTGGDFFFFFLRFSLSLEATEKKRQFRSLLFATFGAVALAPLCPPADTGSHAVVVVEQVQNVPLVSRH